MTTVIQPSCIQRIGILFTQHHYVPLKEIGMVLLFFYYFKKGETGS